MTDWLGPLQAVTIAGSLWVILAFPLAAATFSAWAALARRSDERVHHAIGVASIGAMVLAFVASAWHAVALAAMAAPERFLLQHVFRMVRVGQLDASFDLALDPLSSTMTLVVTGVGALIFVYSASYMDGDPSYARFFAWLNLFVFAMLVLVLADNLVAMFFGWEGVGLCSWGLIGFWFDDESKARAGAKAFLVNRVGDAGFLLGIAVLFWGLGGAWEDGEYAPDLEARFASVAVVSGAEAEGELPAASQDAHARAGQALLTMTAYSGAVVYMDDSSRPIERAPGEPLRAPFSRAPVPAGVHTFRVHPGAGLDDALVPRVTMNEGREVAIAAVGPSLVFRAIRDELTLRDPNGRASFADGLLSKRGAGKMGVVTLACLLLFLGAVGKSAQVPLHVWLPDAMAGPTPVSALIHAATMVTAGVYMIARLGFLFALSPTASTVVACTGAFTAIVAAAVGAYQYDLKRILAFSTISQLGLMIVGVGVGAYAAAIFHVVTHAFMKACLFLSASSVFGAMGMMGHEEEAATQDIRKMGGLARALPRTARAYRIACIAITATPIPGLAGFWSKDDIMVHSFGAHGLAVPGPALGIVMVAVSGVTSFYVWRSYYLVFAGPPGPDAGKIHEPSGSMTRVIEALAGLSAIGGVMLGASTRFFGKGGRSVIESWLSSVLADSAAPGLAIEVSVIAAAYVIALGGWALARSTYGESRASTWEARERRSAMFGALSHAFRFDAIYDAIFVRGALRASEIATEVDRWVVDGAVHGVALASRVAAWIAGRADDSIVDGVVRAAAEGTLGAGDRVRALQSGRVQTYVYIAISGLLALAALQYWLR